MRLPFLRRPAAPAAPVAASAAAPAASAAPAAASAVLAARAPGPPRLVAITRVLDEADVVEAFVRHTAAHLGGHAGDHAGHHLVADNGSRDGTLEILQRLVDEGLNLSVYATGSVSFCEATTNTALYAAASAEHAADWVLALDCDEFIDDRGAAGGLAATLGRVLEETPEQPVIDLPLIEYETASDDEAGEPVVPLRLRRRAAEPVTTKVCVRGGIRGAVVDGGNHAVLLDGRLLPSGRVEGLRLAHYPRRSRYQMASKIAKGYAKVIAAGPGEVAKNTALHYRGLYELLLSSPDAFFAHPHVARPAEADGVLDPIAYRGGALRHTGRDGLERFLLTMLGYVNDLAAQHGRLMDEVPEARARVEQWNGALRRLF